MFLNKNPEYYNGNPKLRNANTEILYTQEQIEEITRCCLDVEYFIENYIKIIHLDKGLIPFELRDFQRDFIKKMHKHRFVIACMARQIGKTISAVGYFIWVIIFHDHKSIAIFANKESTSKDILARLKESYENLPNWLQQGIRSWNKTSIELENGSKIKAFSTSGDAGRSGSYNIVVLEEAAFIRTAIFNEFMNSVFPTISSGETTKLIMISTPKGLNHFHRYWDKAIKGKSAFTTAFANWRAVPGRDEAWKEEMISVTSEEQFNQEHECQFLGSLKTLIKTEVLKELEAGCMEPVNEINSIHMFEEPKRDHKYALFADTAEGQGLDCSAFCVIDVTKKPYVHVAKFQNNKIPPQNFSSIIYSAAKHYNEALVLVELNNQGTRVAESLNDDFEYENLIKVEKKRRVGQEISFGFSKKLQFGVKTSRATKPIGCSHLKTLIDKKNLIIRDEDVVAELKTFVESKGSYAAEEGSNDDLAMCLVLLGWAESQKNFKDMIEVTKSGGEGIDDENFFLMGGIQDGQVNQSETFRDEEGTWEVVHTWKH